MSQIACYRQAHGVVYPAFDGERPKEAQIVELVKVTCWLASILVPGLLSSVAH